MKLFNSKLTLLAVLTVVSNLTVLAVLTVARKLSNINLTISLVLTVSRKLTDTNLKMVLLSLPDCHVWDGGNLCLILPSALQ